MSVNVPTKILPSGARIPMIGLGVYQSEPGPETYNAILTSLKLGYRHIDTAEIYGNEEDVGRAVRDSGIPREEIFVTTKLFTTNWGYSKALAAGKASNDRLGIVYIYLYLLHAPGPPKERADTWRAVEDLREQETLRDIGVSNFNETLLATLRKTAHIKPAVNQVELHPWMMRQSLVNYQDGRPCLGLYCRRDRSYTRPSAGGVRRRQRIRDAAHRDRLKSNLESVKLKVTPEQVVKLASPDSYLRTAGCDQDRVM
uniref:Aldo-keto reductase, putative n=1 Tax=Phytophthora infestans TaxID=4787 RepID=Q572D2_PHYIN|nr:aldo-keto reductase, putative [Phytophthora infestans]CAI72346.1 aldo-keto reductase, putative [Phytophthora infestans]